jgi:hypothetical protein
VIRVPLAPLLGLLLLGASGRARADTPAADREREPAPEAAASPKKKPLLWHDSTVIWQQRAGSQTVHVGSDYQSSDPYYDWVFYVRPRFYFWENERSSVSLRAQVWTTYEFTNSDITTQKNELIFGDTLLSLVPAHAFVKQGEYLTELELSLPRLVLPTSKASYDSGEIAQLGVRAYLLQAFPLREGQSFLARAHAALRVGYSYQFARSTVPENPNLNQGVTDWEGVVVNSHQVAGAALAEHVGIFHGLIGADIWRDIFALEAEFGLDPSWKFRLPPSQPICGNVLTGCTVPGEPPDPQTYGVVTYLDAHLDFLAFGGSFTTSIGWENITLQNGPDGQHRNAFWSPDAKLYLRFELQPDLLFEPRAVSRYTRARALTNVASAR